MNPSQKLTHRRPERLPEVPELPASAHVGVPALVQFCKHQVLVWSAFPLPPSSLLLKSSRTQLRYFLFRKPSLTPFPGWWGDPLKSFQNNLCTTLHFHSLSYVVTIVHHLSPYLNYKLLTAKQDLGHSKLSANPYGINRSNYELQNVFSL